MMFGKKLAGLALGGAALVGGSVTALAYGAWTSSGSGSASDGASSVAIQDSTISLASGGAAANLWPGRSVDLKVTVSNPNPYPVVVTSLGGGASNAVGDCAAGALSTNTLSGSAVAQSGSSTTVIAKESSADYTLSVTMSSDAARACAGKTFTVSGLTAALKQSGA